MAMWFDAHNLIFNLRCLTPADNITCEGESAGTNYQTINLPIHPLDFYDDSIPTLLFHPFYRV